jgi:hypothetical protein
MLMNFPKEYIGFKFLQLCPYSNYSTYTNKYVGCCPICREGNSFGKKKRCAYIPDINYITCLNCGENLSPINWIMKVSGMTFYEVIQDFNSFKTTENVEILDEVDSKPKSELTIPDLPYNEIDLFNEDQLEYYKGDKNVQKALSFIKKRKLDQAVNKPNKYCISLVDKFHKNRLIIPFIDENLKVLNYQSRALDDNPVRYLTKYGGTSCLFNYNKIDSEFYEIFIFEGPFDSTFVKNGVAIGGIQENSNKIFKGIQEAQIKQFPFHRKIWVLDSQYKDKAALSKSIKLLESGENVFIWPKKIGSLCKDFNDISMMGYMEYITSDWIIKNAFTGSEGVKILNKIKI